jgi:predicted O-methyltransferase YrrM
MGYLGIGTRNRLFFALTLLFITTLVLYMVVYYIYELLAVATTMAWSTSVIIYVMYRWRVEPAKYDAQLEELRSLFNLQPVVSGAFLPLGTWAMEPKSLLHLLSTIQLNHYETIVECGSGVSTIAIGKLLRQSGRGHLYSLEEDKNWYSIMSTVLARECLSEYVTLLHAPLEHNPNSEAQWYTVGKSQQILDSVRRIDLLLIDGPKSVKTYSRFPALPIFAPSLDANSLIVLDDSKRQNETAVLKRWHESFDLLVEEPYSSIRGQAYIRLRANSKG